MMRLSRRRRFLLAAAAGVLFVAGCSSKAFVPPGGDVPVVPDRLASDAGPRDRQAPVLAALMLRVRDEDGLEAFADAAGDPRSPQFHRFLTPAQYERRFAPTVAQETRVIAALRAAGFTIVRRYADRAFVEAAAPTAIAQRFFATDVHDFDEGRYGRRYANVTPLAVPEALRNDVEDVELNDIVFAQSDGLGPSTRGRGRGKPLAGPTYGPSLGWAPRAVADGFDLPVQHGFNGHGTTIAMVVQSSIDTADLTAFLKENSIVRRGKIVETPVNGGPTTGDKTDAMIQIEAMAALAPGTSILAYETPDLSDVSVLDAYHKAILQNVADVVNSSFGTCDFSDKPFDMASEREAIHASALGISFVAAAGDTGSTCFDRAKSKNKYGVNVPAADPHVLAVGGTESVSGQLTATPCPCPISTPIAWDDHNISFGGLTGGGVSRRWKIPKYQRGVSGSPASTTNRNVPDIAFPAVDDDVLINGVDVNVDGTSWSSAIASAWLVQTVQMCGRLGAPHGAIYAAYASAGHSVFFDPISGSNGGYVPALPKGYAAAPGYDDVTGLGMPYGFRLAQTICKAK